MVLHSPPHPAHPVGVQTIPFSTPHVQAPGVERHFLRSRSGKCRQWPWTFRAVSVGVQLGGTHGRVGVLFRPGDRKARRKVRMAGWCAPPEAPHFAGKEL